MSNEGAKRTKSVKKKRDMPLIDSNVLQHRDALLGGTVLAIDPSSGSAGSQPGYAIYKNGVVQEIGTVEIGQGVGINSRLFALRHALMEEFDQPDLLITENIAPMFGKGMPVGVLNLHRSLGVIMSCWDVPCILVAPQIWRQYIGPDYPKGDANDACMLGYSAIARLCAALETDHPTSPEMLKKWVYRKVT